VPTNQGRLTAHFNRLDRAILPLSKYNIQPAYCIDLSSGQQMLVLMTTTMAAIVAAVFPEEELVAMVIVLELLICHRS